MRARLEALVLEMYGSGIPYALAVREFQKCFIETALRENRGNQVKAARELHMHRNSLSRAIAKLELDVRALRPSRRPPKSELLASSGKRISLKPGPA